MNVEELREFCLSLSHTTEDMPFDDQTLVFKVGGRIYVLIGLVGQLEMIVKCDPDEALEMREAFDAVRPGYHMNKKHWNSVLIDGSISDSMLKIWIEKSYKLVVSKLTKQERTLLGI